MRLIIKILLISIIIIFLLYYLGRNIEFETIIAILTKLFNFKIKIKNPENLKHVDDRVIFMSNHYSISDAVLIMYIINKVSDKKIYFVSKHNIFGDKNDTSALSNFLSLFKGLYNFCNIIPYEKGNKQSGEKVKNRMRDIVNQNNTVILFPEGTTSRLGIPSEFKPGSFKMCAENSIKIIPLTLEYDKRIGMNQFDNFDILSLINSGVTITIHKPIYNKDPLILQQQVYHAIIDELKMKYINRNIIQ
jgi:1-acyl-sn-glycerol-3-phosphate acyltransferase